ncbi:putative uncharacterized protein DDB_G0289263 isoform X2 [Oppia nitens]|uniref:putative uncharacterized protein DDB_G0289263 isoform X2 n=1 Tax=Oppia nitens TaxID=1686743 RepID=UPI0023D97D0B|nr:putative uncharacterized protein DDB_G0289263 isoform X2 [Oppia nitens]
MASGGVVVVDSDTDALRQHIRAIIAQKVDEYSQLELDDETNKNLIKQDVQREMILWKQHRKPNTGKLLTRPMKKSNNYIIDQLIDAEIDKIIIEPDTESNCSTTMTTTTNYDNDNIQFVNDCQLAEVIAESSYQFAKQNNNNTNSSLIDSVGGGGSGGAKPKRLLAQLSQQQQQPSTSIGGGNNPIEYHNNIESAAVAYVGDDDGNGDDDDDPDFLEAIRLSKLDEEERLQNINVDLNSNTTLNDNIVDNSNTNISNKLPKINLSTNLVDDNDNNNKLDKLPRQISAVENINNNSIDIDYKKFMKTLQENNKLLKQLNKLETRHANDKRVWTKLMAELTDRYEKLLKQSKQDKLTIDMLMIKNDYNNNNNNNDNDTTNTDA